MAGFQEELYVCMYGTNQFLLLEDLNHSVTLKACGCSPAFAIVGFLLAHLKQVVLAAKECKKK